MSHSNHTFQDNTKTQEKPSKKLEQGDVLHITRTKENDDTIYENTAVQAVQTSTDTLKLISLGSANRQISESFPDETPVKDVMETYEERINEEDTVTLEKHTKSRDVTLQLNATEAGQ